jgi:hypothetical protein
VKINLKRFGKFLIREALPVALGIRDLDGILNDEAIKLAKEYAKHNDISEEQAVALALLLKEKLVETISCRSKTTIPG